MDPAHVLAGPKVTALLSGQRGDGGFGVHPYRKWTGAHWRLVSLAELAFAVGILASYRCDRTPRKGR